MKTKLFLIVGIILMLFFACKGPRKPKGNEFAWSPDGKYLAMEQINSDELLLVETGDQGIKQITFVDSKAEAPHWSFDGRYLLYYKRDSEKKTVSVLNYSIIEKQSNMLLTLSNIPDSLYNSNYLTFWSPVANRFAYISKTGKKNWTIETVSTDGRNKNVLLKSVLQPFYPQWSKDGKRLYYALRGAEKKRGIWSVSSDGKYQKHVLKDQLITALQQSPNGSRWAYIRNFGENNDYYQLIITDADFKPVKKFYRLYQHLKELDWSPNSKQIIFKEEGDDYRNLWLTGVESQSPIRITFDNLENYFGWRDGIHFAYTIKYPDEIVPLNIKEKDNREMMKMLYGQSQLNKCLISDRQQKVQIGENIYSDTYCSSDGKSAFYIAYKEEMDLLDDDEIYLPVIKFSDEEVHYLIRNHAEEVKMMHLNYRSGDYLAARANMVQYWKQKYQIENIGDFSNFQDIINTRKDDTEKSYYEIMKDECQVLLKMVLLHRRLNDNDIADHLLTEMSGLIKDEESWDHMNDFFSFMIMSTYFKYNAMLEGVKDIDMMMSWRPADSLYIAELNFTQAFLLDVVNERKTMLEKFNNGIAMLPVNVETDNLFTLGFLAERYKHDREVVAAISTFGDHLLLRNKLDDDVARLLAEIYLTKGEQDKAYLAYQKAVTAGFDQHELWQKLFELRVGMRR
jgi:Tol biopolymer transport system component